MGEAHACTNPAWSSSVSRCVPCTVLVQAPPVSPRLQDAPRAGTLRGSAPCTSTVLADASMRAEKPLQEVRRGTVCLSARRTQSETDDAEPPGVSLSWPLRGQTWNPQALRAVFRRRRLRAGNGFGRNKRRQRGNDRMRQQDSEIQGT